MKKKRQRRISVLFIPDDNAEPYNFRLSWPTAKLLMAVGVVLALHIVVGGVTYGKYFRVRAENNELERSNTRLLEDNKRVYQLSADFEKMSKEQAKILSLLGVDPQAKGGVNLSALLPANQPMAATKVQLQPALETANQPVQEEASPSGGFLLRRRDENARYAPTCPRCCWWKVF
jgi:hypothetical protein